ncbi:MAG TPA: hypothetical protein VK188_09475 [Holophaga sp.]|nr:hypothetical protein [Holophaga sp.]
MPRPDSAQRLIDTLFARVVTNLTLASAGLELLILLGRFPGWLRGTTPFVLLAGPFLAFLICAGGTAAMLRLPPSRGLSNRVLFLGNGSVAVVFGAMAMWYADPSRLFVFTILLLMAGPFQRDRRLYALNLALTTASLLFGLAWAPMPPATRGIAASIFIASAAAGIFTHVLVGILVARLHRALARARAFRMEVAVLRGLIPICAHCKKVRNDGGYWEQVETYITTRTEASFSHGICPECVERHFPPGRRG